MKPENTFQLHHTYEIDGMGDEPMTVVARNVDFATDGANYVMLMQAEGPHTVSIYPVELDSPISDPVEALLLPCPWANDVDFDEDGNPLPYWSPVCECPDVTAQYPWDD